MAPDALELLYVITPHKDIINDHGGGDDPDAKTPQTRKETDRPI